MRTVQQLVAELFPSLLFLNQQIKGLCQCQANRPQPTGYRLDDREQIKQKDKCSLRVSGSISDSSDPRQFLSSFPSAFFFFAAQLGTNPIVKGDCWERHDALSSSTELCFFFFFDNTKLLLQN